MGKTTNKNPLAKSLKAYDCFMFIRKSLDPASFDTKEKSSLQII